jgi:O-antigen/teichoic acid export membrane protein
MTQEGDSGESSRVRNAVATLFITNTVSFGIVGLSYLAYSRLLQPSQLGVYSAALVVGTVGTMVLDAGLKVSIIKSAHAPNPVQLRALVAALTMVSVVLSLLLIASVPLIETVLPAIKSDYAFLVEFSITYLISYPLMMMPTAMLERRLAYTAVAWVESAGLVLERALPAVLVLAGHGLQSFVWSLVIGRVVRVLALSIIEPVGFGVPRWDVIRTMRPFLFEGFFLQLAAGLSIVRDNLHVILVAPLFGKTWTGYYAWGLQLCVIASQAFVQISSRIAVPLFAREAMADRRWAQCLFQIRWLTIILAPVLATLPLIMQAVDKYWFGERWESAAALLPLLFLRMLPGVATTPLGALVVVQNESRRFARLIGLWTLAETCVAFVMLLVVGPTGLAWSYAAIVWAGLFLLASASGQEGALRSVVHILLLRPGLWVAAALSATSYVITRELNISDIYILLAGQGCAVLLGYVSEAAIRQRLLLLMRVRKRNC